ncbi:TPA: hypothetical protein HA338_10730 [Methanosarcina acetivorans]|uniref:Uncharacterized protein n=2 Tax=Methanosarcina acetivorans TaxID=2214 RepID=Q8TNR1_METAC|nr:hypothetical protein [Methanosarcina acetivorans]AAM05617.1 predicted protein [Methanosarcina acetivorans C2A]HIH94472.1 hypothetical protein [Methanosarcina acetivorans]
MEALERYRDNFNRCCSVLKCLNYIPVPIKYISITRQYVIAGRILRRKSNCKEVKSPDEENLKPGKKKKILEKNTR